jgi:hypothetical protein
MQSEVIGGRGGAHQHAIRERPPRCSAYHRRQRTPSARRWRGASRPSADSLSDGSLSDDSLSGDCLSGDCLSGGSLSGGASALTQLSRRRMGPVGRWRVGRRPKYRDWRMRRGRGPLSRGRAARAVAAAGRAGLRWAPMAGLRWACPTSLPPRACHHRLECEQRCEQRCEQSCAQCIDAPRPPRLPWVTSRRSRGPRRRGGGRPASVPAISGWGGAHSRATRRAEGHLSSAVGTASSADTASFV